MTTGDKRRTDEWPIAREELLRTLWDGDGNFSARRIALELGGGLTRSAVIGKAHRMGLKKKGQGGGRTKVPRKEPRIRTKSTFNRPANAKIEPPKRIEMTPVLPAVDGGLTLLDPRMTAERCHAVVSHPPGRRELPRYCGHPVLEGESYCEPHYRAFHQEPRLRVR